MSDGMTKLYCSFCEKSQDEVETLVVRGDAGICNECIEVAVVALEKYRSKLLDEVRRLGT